METEIMTLREAVIAIMLLQRERDMLLTETPLERVIRMFNESTLALEESLARQTMQRPGIQSGLKKLEEMEATQ